MAEVKIMLREGLGMVYTSPSISGVGKVKAGELFRKREEFPLAKQTASCLILSDVGGMPSYHLCKARLLLERNFIFSPYCQESAQTFIPMQIMLDLIPHFCFR